MLADKQLGRNIEINSRENPENTNNVTCHKNSIKQFKSINNSTNLTMNINKND